MQTHISQSRAKKYSFLSHSSSLPPPTQFSPDTATASTSAWEKGAGRVVSSLSHNCGSVEASFCPHMRWKPTWTPTSKPCSPSIVGHTAGLRRQVKKKSLDHCLFSLIFIVPLLFLPLITSNRKVPFCFFPLLQLLV